MPKRRTYLLGVAVATAAAGAAWATAVMPSALAGGIGATGSGAYASSDPTSAPPSPSDDPAPPDEVCPAPSPTEIMVALPVGLAPRVTGPVTCNDGKTKVKVSWDGTKITIAISASKPNNCGVDPDSILIGDPMPTGTKISGLIGEITVPYDKQNREKITVKIQYTLACWYGGVRHDEVRRLDVQFTPPSGPVVIDEK